MELAHPLSWQRASTETRLHFEDFVLPHTGRRSQARLTLGHFLSSFQPFRVKRLMRFNELRGMLQLWLSAEFKRFADEELRGAEAAGWECQNRKCTCCDHAVLTRRTSR